MTKDLIADIVLMYIGEFKDSTINGSILVVKFQDKETMFLDLNQMQYLYETDQLEKEIYDKINGNK